MTESSFPWPRKGTENRRLSAVVGAFLLAIDVLPTPRKSVRGPEAALRAPLFARFDPGWRDSIVRCDDRRPPLEGGPSSDPFFPLCPTPGRFVRLLSGIDSFRSGLLVTRAALLLDAAPFTNGHCVS